MTVWGWAAWWASSEGTCKGISMNSKSDGHIDLSGGSGTCKGRDAVKELRCAGANTYKAVTTCGKVIYAKPGTALLQKWSRKLDMSIDDLLDHPEHGPHAKNLLVDSYKQSLAKGESLLETSQTFATPQKHQLEERHLRTAIDLHSKLPEFDKKIRTVPIGFSVTFDQ